GTIAATAPPLVERTLQPFSGDPKASPSGWVDGAATGGNNIIAGTNPRGTLCVTGIGNCLYPPLPVTAAGLNFSFPLVLGPSAPAPTQFSDAAVTNAFYWANRAHDLFYSIGFDEASGNFQERNFGRGGAGGDAMYLYVQYGVAATGTPRLNNSSFAGYGAADDGTRTSLRLYVNTLPGYLADDAYDAGVILHEYTHGVTFRLAQDLYSTYQGASMAEAWSDFFALEFLTPEGSPVDGSYELGAYAFGSGALRSRPYSTSLETNPLTFANLAHVLYLPEVHADGEIWMEAMWEARAALIRQFGEKEGRRRARIIALDSLKLSTPAPSMVDARDAVLLADRVNFAGASQDVLWAAFARRGLGVLAQSDSADSTHISPSFDLPSKTGAIGFYDGTVVIGEPVRIILHDANLTTKSATLQLTSSSGDLETIQLRKRGSAYYGAIWTSYAPVFRGDATLAIVPDDTISAYYKDEDTGSGWKLIDRQQQTSTGYAGYLSDPAPPKFSGEAAAGLRSASQVRSLRTLPFEFPFYGKTYKTIWVSNYGVVTFDSPNTQVCTDPIAFASLKGIAGLFMPIATAGSAQKGEDVYISQTADTYSIRWAGETSLVNPYAAPDPVNFAITLHSDGQIDFQYGAGNRSLTAVNTPSGCPAGTATIGVSNGNETYPQLSGTLGGSGSLENALSLIYLPPYPPSGVPIIALESPADGDTVHGVLTGKGTVYDVDANTPIRRMDVLIDGVAHVPASVNLSRPDYCATNKVNGCPYVGFTFSVSTALENVLPGRHTLQLRATNARGVTNTYPDTPLAFNVEPGETTKPVARLELPSAGESISGLKTIRGYAGLPDARIRNIDVLIDGITYGAATYGATRTD
ncbi:MAG: M36 family metallopeptidase, partial [Acidobacteria bacterium]|nr:M36 family metallopeptidase [Acidobacteriota bacterium]